MSVNVVMPKVGESVTSGIIAAWLKNPGDTVAIDEAIVSVETDKATVVYEAESAGTLASILVPEGGTAAVGQAIATLGNGEGPAPTERPPAPVQEAAANAPPVPEPVRSEPSDGAGPRRPW